jgi:hypothetical protein
MNVWMAELIQVGLSGGLWLKMAVKCLTPLSLCFFLSTFALNTHVVSFSAVILESLLTVRHIPHTRHFGCYRLKYHIVKPFLLDSCDIDYMHRGQRLASAVSNGSV